MAEDSVLPDEKKIYDLTEIYEERNGRNNSEVIIVDGRGYERVSKENKYINDLADFTGEQSAANKTNEEILKRVTEITERIAREILPDVAERVIREEIDKLKKLSGIGSNAVK